MGKHTNRFGTATSQGGLIPKKRKSYQVDSITERQKGLRDVGGDSFLGKARGGKTKVRQKDCRRSNNMPGMSIRSTQPGRQCICS